MLMPYGTHRRRRLSLLACLVSLALLIALGLTASPASATAPSVATVAIVTGSQFTSAPDGDGVVLHCAVSGITGGESTEVQIQPKALNKSWSEAPINISKFVTSDQDVSFTSTDMGLFRGPGSVFEYQCRVRNASSSNLWVYSPTKKQWTNAAYVSNKYLPQANNEPATSVTDLTATGHCEANAGGYGSTDATVTAQLFEYNTGIETDLGTQPIPVANGDNEFNYSLTGLNPSTAYYVYCSADNPLSGSSDTQRTTFTTTASVTPGLPVVQSAAVTNVTATTVDTHCDVDATHADTTVMIQYHVLGTSWTTAITYPSSGSRPVVLGTTTGSQPVTISLSGLVENTQYEMQCIAYNSVSLAAGPNIVGTLKRTWTATASGGTTTPDTKSVAATNVTDSSATIACSTNPGNQTVEVWTQYHVLGTSWTTAINFPSPHSTVTGPTGTYIPSSWNLTGLAPSTSYEMQCLVRVGSTGSGIPSLGKKTWTTTAAAGGGGGTSVTIAAAGDICDTAALGGTSSCSPAASLINFYNPAKVLLLGDNQYDEGSLTHYQTIYGGAGGWGQFLGKTIPVLGNHEERTLYAQGYCDYFGAAAACVAQGSRAANNSTQRVDLGKWSIITLDSTNRGADDPAGYLSDSCKNDTSSQVQCSSRVAAFHQLLLDAGTDNVIVAFHQPRWASTCSTCHGNNAGVKPFYDEAVAMGVDLILNGHDHVYERFNKMTGSGVAGANPGVVEFVAGTGGAHPDTTVTGEAGSAFQQGGVEGPLLLTLNDTSIDFKMVNVDGTAAGTVIDSGNIPVNP